MQFTPPPTERRKRTWLIVAAAGAALTVVGGTVAVVALRGSDDGGRSSAAVQPPGPSGVADASGGASGAAGGPDNASPRPSGSGAPAQLKAGFALAAGQALRSPNGKYTLMQQQDGNLVLADEAKRVQWSSQTSASPGATASLDRTGDLVVYAKNQTVLWRSSTNGQGALLEVRDDGNAAVTRTDHQEVWSSRNERTRLYPGQTLTAGQLRRTADGRFTLAQNADGNLVVVNADKKVVWSAQTSGHQGAYTLMQPDGNLVVYGPDKQPLWSSGTFDHSGAAAVLTGDGNLTLAAGGTVLWGSATDGTTKLTVGQRLGAGQSRSAPKGGFELLMQPDGNLVLRNAAKSVVWRSGTDGHPGASARLQPDGNLVIYDGADTAIWSTKTSGKAATALLVQDDGTVVLHTAAKQVIWKAP
ncbi:hypothetical protein [Dactylosporangium sp. NPDC051541]|uniref:hypothetical protein n=1 Tax=Dactylosporangium sp. NPDC051541 TaxID=3363977 RepID=UPI0037ACD8CD